MTAAPIPSGPITFDEYIELAEKSRDKLDFSNGRVVNVSELIAMSGGSLRHSLIIANLIATIHGKLKGKPCRVFESNLRIGSGKGSDLHFPDVTIICGPAIGDPRDKSKQTQTNPTTLFEVLSPSTMGYDFGEKFTHYSKIESLREYVLVYQDRSELITFLRRDDGDWKISVHHDPAANVPIESVGIELAMADIYDGVEFPDAEQPTAT
jgi:Uma2 family endonuclease